jgi:hypothetical protein
MVKNAQLFSITRLRGPITGAYGHAMPCNPEWNICDVGLRLLTPITFVAQGITMPISRGGPPILTE